MRKNSILGVVFCVLLMAPFAVFAQKPNPQKGRIYAYTCLGCHGIKGYMRQYPSYHVPRIGGQHYQYLVSALNEYRNGQRHFATMVAQAQSLSEQQIKDIAAWLSEQKGQHKGY